MNIGPRRVPPAQRADALGTRWLIAAGAAGVLAAVVGISGTPVTVARAQGTGTATATLVVSVVSSATGEPLAGVQLRLRHARSAFSLTDSAGRATMPGIAPRADTLDLRRLGFQPRAIAIGLDSAGVIEVALSLQPIAVRLDTMVTTGRHTSSVVGFDDRRRQGQGYFIDRKEIDRRQPRVMTDLLATVPGVRLVPVQNGYQIRSSRSAGPRDCPMSTFVDGAQVSGDPGSGSSAIGARVRRQPPTPTLLDAIPPTMIEAVEVYVSTGVPPQFSRGNAGCGVVLIWTRIAR
ncbi:MAG: TonB-dependent receptor plug domain-containing protein [Gemmatimonadaceae bacterium]